MAIGKRWWIKQKIRGLCLAIAFTIGRRWLKSIRLRVVCSDPGLDVRENPAGHILSIWHRDIIMGCTSLATDQLKVLVSQSKDGSTITRTIEELGFSTIRGSSKRGGVQAMREMLREARESCVAITPDGPKGPALEVKEGVAYLASRSGAPVIAVGCAYSWAMRMRSWDRLYLPLPCSRVVVYLMPTMTVPQSAEKHELDHYSAELQQQMVDAQASAEDELAKWSAGRARSEHEPQPARRARIKPAERATC
ncbi:lysophospholipid acyltransferase family protein [Anatilimnocola sp. NA78]|uniref:lysophospholipid acyltransferase family protein n=1 Tax=Anatilimnocola sp. NA78 TaxID=3415683 RepID=UPI003CE591E8